MFLLICVCLLRACTSPAQYFPLWARPDLCSVSLTLGLLAFSTVLMSLVFFSDICLGSCWTGVLLLLVVSVFFWVHFHSSLLHVCLSKWWRVLFFILDFLFFNFCSSVPSLLCFCLPAVFPCLCSFLI